MTMSMYRDVALASIKRHEGLRLRAYQDTVGVWTIGYGTNLEELEIDVELANALLMREFNVAEGDAKAFAGPVWELLDDNRKAVLIDMAYNLGLPRLMRFVNFRQALQKRKYAKAAREMLASKWAQQVGIRAERLASVMRGDT